MGQALECLCLKAHFFEVLGGAFKYFSVTSTCACTYSIGAFKHIIKHKGFLHLQLQLKGYLGKVFRPERCRLADTTFFKLMFISCNNIYLQ